MTVSPRLDAVVGAVVAGFDDVGALAGEDPGEVEERAGAVREIDAEAQPAAVLDEAALDDVGEQGDVDVAAADEDDGAWPVSGGFVLDRTTAARAAAPAPSARVFSARGA